MYEELRIKYPLVDKATFRRILGMSETISAWTWPELNTLDAVSITLKDRIKMLDVEIANNEDNAKIYASSAEDLAKLQRNAKVAEATYTVLIEQVKSQSLAAGYNSDSFKIFESATTPLGATSPRRNLMLAVGLFIGLILGCSVAFVIALRKGTYYSKIPLISDSQPKLAIESHFIKKISRWPISKIDSYLSKKRILDLDEAEVNLANKKLIYILNCGGRPFASKVAQLLATKSHRSGRKVILCEKRSVRQKNVKKIL